MTGDLPHRLVTVSSPEFLLGTRVMIHSFLAKNHWFAGEIIVLHSRLRPADVTLLEREFANLSCKLADQRLADAVDALVAEFPHLEGRRDRFLSLDMLFEPNGPTLFLDSDMLIRSDLSPLARTEAAMVACPDATMLRGRRRDLQTMEESEGEGVTFNAGMMLVTPAADDLADSVLQRLTPQCWAEIRSDHTDQAVWNLLFADRVQLADSRHNYMVGHAGLLSLVEADWPTLYVLHFNGPAKPWLPDRQQAAAAEGGFAGWAFEQWREAARSMLAGAR